MAKKKTTKKKKQVTTPEEIAAKVEAAADLKLSPKQRKGMQEGRLGGTDAAKCVEMCRASVNRHFPTPNDHGYVEHNGVTLYYKPSVAKKLKSILTKLRSVETEIHELGLEIVTYQPAT